jgi:hypothetical protein
MSISANNAKEALSPSEPQDTAVGVGEQVVGIPLQRGAAVDLIAITLLWCLAVLIVNPVGNFPLNDDWAMGQTVKQLVEKGQYQPSGWTSMPMISQVFWGALFCLPKGFSFTALRCSTLVMSLLGVLGIYALIRQLGRSRVLSVIGALALGFNPIYFALSNTFMTDVPFAALAAWSSWFFVRHLQRESLADLLLATALATAAALCRQLALCLPLAFGAALLLRRGCHQGSLLRGLLPFVVVGAALAALKHWLTITGKLPAQYDLSTGKLLLVLKHPLRIPLNVVYYGWSMMMYLGLFLLPVTLPAVFNTGYRSRCAQRIMAVRITLGLFFLATVVRLIIVPSLMPVHYNIIIPQGIGPAILHDSNVKSLPNLPPLPSFFWLVVTGLSLFGAALLAVYLVMSVLELSSRFRQTRGTADDSVRHFFLFAVVLYLAPLLLSGFFDRYLIPAVVFGLGLVVLARGELAWPNGRGQYLAAILLVSGFAIFGVTGTRDYLEWNRVRWRALDELLAQKDITPGKVDGGFEFNGYYKYDTFTKTNWWLVDDSYAITFGEMKGFTPLQQYRYRNWLPPREGRILALKRTGPAQPKTTVVPER